MCARGLRAQGARLARASAHKFILKKKKKKNLRARRLRQLLLKRVVFIAQASVLGGAGA
jgi:hypothetical protein